MYAGNSLGQQGTRVYREPLGKPTCLFVNSLVWAAVPSNVTPNSALGTELEAAIPKTLCRLLRCACSRLVSALVT